MKGQAERAREIARGVGLNSWELGEEGLQHLQLKRFRQPWNSSFEADTWARSRGEQPLCSNPILHLAGEKLFY